MRVFLVCLSLLAFNFSSSPAVASTSEVAEANSSGAWCVTPRHIFNISDIGLKKSVKENYCGRDGKRFHSKSEANAEFKRLTGSSYSGYSYSDKIWCVEKWDYAYMPFGQCVGRKGEVFASEDEAKARNELREKAEYKRIADSSDWKTVWCATKWQVIRREESACAYTWRGTAYSTEGEARAALQLSRNAKTKVNNLASPAIASTQAWNSLHDHPDHEPGWSSNSYWCVAKNRIWETTGWDCWYNNKGEYFKSQTEAEAEVQKRDPSKKLSEPALASLSAGNSWCVTYYGIKQMSEMSCAYVGGRPHTSFDSAVVGHEQQSIGNSTTALRKGWCATPNWVQKTTAVFCDASDGEFFENQSFAEARHEFLSQLVPSRDYSNTAYCLHKRSGTYYFGPNRDPWNAGCTPGDLEVSLHEYIQGTPVPTLLAEQKRSTKPNEVGSHLVWCGEIKPSVGIRWVWRNTRASCIESGGTVIAADDQTKAYAEEAYDSMLAQLDDPYVECRYGDEIVTEKRSACKAKYGFHTSGNLIWCGKSFKRSCSEESESVALHPSTGWCASPWDVRYTSRKNCNRTDEELWPTVSGAQTAHARLRNEHYEGLNVVVWCATADSFQKTRITDCESIDGTTWSTKALARVEHNRLNSVLSVAQVQAPKKVWCATASDTWETTESTCHSLGGRGYGDRRMALNESARRLKAQKDREHIQRKNEAIAQRKQNLEKLLATKSCRECDLRGVDLRKADLNGAILVKADLQGAGLVMASLEGSNLTGANLREVDLTGANLAKATLRKADLSQVHVTPRLLNLFPTNLSWADLSEAKLIGANLAGVDFTGAVLTGADLTRANLLNADLEDADLSAAILIETSLIEADLDHADLTDANLSQANLTNACLDRTNLSRANLSNTFLSKATFRKANLNQVNLQKARLNNADLSGIDLRGADLSEANLTRADLRGTGLEGAQLQGANLYEADLTGADLSRADLEGVNLIRARLRIADLRWSKLSGAELDGAKLVGANLTGANLARASLNRSDLSRANLTKADLSGADLNRADLSRTALSQAILVETDLYRATLDKADLSQADLTNADLTGVSSQEVIWDQVVLCGTMMQSREIDDSGCKPEPKSTEPINHRS